LDKPESRISRRENIAKRLEFDLKAGHKVAYLYTDTTEYRYMETLDAAKKWFQSNVDTIMNVYSYRHHIQKEDLFLGARFRVYCIGRSQ
jgi:hypothetical protein